MTTRFRWTNKAVRFPVLCLGLAITASCSDDEPVNGYAKTHVLGFGVSVPQEWHTSLKTRSAAEAQACNATRFDNSELWLTASIEPNKDTTLFRSPRTRAASVTTDDFYDSFSVYGYVYKGANWAERTDVTTYFENETVTNQNGIWTTDQTKYWPGASYRMNFFAYAPSDMAATLTVKNHTPVELKYTVPPEVTEQKDLVVATTDVAGNHNQSVVMDFKHILTAVKVTAAKGMSGTIKKVAFPYIWNIGIYSFNNEDWIRRSAISRFELEREVRLDPYAENDTPIADGAYTFMMIPQRLPAGAKLEITIADDNGERTVEADLSGDWPIGHTVTYRISKAKPTVEYAFSATDPTAFTGEGGSNPVEIQSYKTVNGADKTPVAWENAGYYSKTENGDYTSLVGDAAPDWLQFPTYQANTTNYNVEVYQQYGTTWDRTGENHEKTVTSPDKVLQKMQEIGSKEDPVNLAGTTGAETTANCYIVNAPGWYKFPIVYGNALIDGAPNPAAYNGNCFVNHLDKQIKAPWLKDNGITVDNAVLLWQDSPEGAPLIDQNSMQVDGDYILFHIPQGDNCMQGNAVIAIKDTDADVAWSWHIWVTLCKPEETFEFGNYSFFKALLGYREAELVTFPKREVYVKLIQNESGKVEFVHVSQDPLYQYVAAGNAPYYQHGRKDPFPGASLKIDRNNGKYSLTVLRDRITGFEAKPIVEDYTLGFAIKNPDTYVGQVAGNTNWYWYRGRDYDTSGGDTGYKNLWDNNDTKTVYDPCPAGYKIPTRAAFEKVAETDKANVEYINTGLYFINHKDQENEQRFFLQILSSRGYEEDYISKVIRSSANADLYCNESNGSTSAHYLHFNGQSKESYAPKDTYWVSHETACAGRCILPQKE